MKLFQPSILSATLLALVSIAHIASADPVKIDLSTPGLDASCLEVDPIIIDQQTWWIPVNGKPAQVRSIQEQMSRTEAMQVRIQACNAPVFHSCYPELKPSMPAGELNQRFAVWIKSPIYRMVDGAGQCAQRAYMLAHELSEAGFDVRQVQMEAPGIAAWARNAAGDRTFPDIYDNHTVVMIRASTKNGLVEMILDPQYQNTPVEKAKYEKTVIGTHCVTPRPGLHNWNCVKTIHPANWQSDRRAPEVKMSISNTCGWPAMDHYTKDLSDTNRRLAKSVYPPVPELAALIKKSDPQAALVEAAWRSNVTFFKSQVDGFKRNREPIYRSNRLEPLKTEVDYDNELSGLQTKFEEIFGTEP